MTAMTIVDGTLMPTPLPLPGLLAGEVLIKTAYVGINRADLLQRDGKYPPPPGAPPYPGLEISGTIAGLSEGVSGFTLGEKVCALLGGGGYAEYVAAPAAQVLPVPSTLTLAQAASVPEAVATSIMALVRTAHLRPNERVLIHGGTSGLGILMIQIAKLLGAEVFTTVGSDEKIAFLAPLGITAINHHASPFAEQIRTRTNQEGVDVIIDTLGAPALPDHLSLLRRNGRLVSLAMMQGAEVSALKIGRMLTHHLCWTGTTLRSRTVAEKAEIIQQVKDLIWPALADGRLKPATDRVFALTDAEKALKYLQERLHLGKILLEVGPN